MVSKISLIILQIETLIHTKGAIDLTSSNLQFNETKSVQIYVSFKGDDFI